MAFLFLKFVLLNAYGVLLIQNHEIQFYKNHNRKVVLILLHNIHCNIHHDQNYSCRKRNQQRGLKNKPLCYYALSKYVNYTAFSQSSNINVTIFDFRHIAFIENKNFLLTFRELSIV